MAKAIAGQLKAVLTPDEVEKIDYRPTANQAAYDAYAKARFLIRNIRDQGPKIAMLDRAVELDPQFAEAWVQLAIECIFTWDTRENRNNPELFEKAHLALFQARQWGPGLAAVPYAENAFALRRDRDLNGSIEKLLEPFQSSRTIMKPEFI